MTERLKLHFENSNATIVSTLEDIKDAMNDADRAHMFPNPNGVEVPVNTENINWVERVETLG